jgi:hypothetical protein
VRPARTPQTESDWYQLHGVGSLAVKKTRKKLSESRVDATGGKKVEKRAVRRGFGDSDSSEEEEEQEEAPAEVRDISG